MSYSLVLVLKTQLEELGMCPGKEEKEGKKGAKQ